MKIILKLLSGKINLLIAIGVQKKTFTFSKNTEKWGWQAAF